MRRFATLLPLLAAACATLTTPLPKEARLSRDTLTVTLTNGERCTGPRAEATPTAAGWAGRLSGCSQPLAYEVRPDAQHNLVQGLLVAGAEAVGTGGLLAEGGEVRVTDAHGRVHVFVSPKLPRGFFHPSPMP
jgi:hypothetical protein